MKHLKYLWWLSLTLWTTNALGAPSLASFQEKPKLVVLVVIDQFRSDYLTRFHRSFLPAQKKKEIGGFNYLMTKGAYYPFAQHDVFQAMTCSGHAMLMTGAYPSENGISMNEWFDRELGKMVYCANDDEFGVSPRRLKTTTVSDELKNTDRKSKVVSLALKDRSAVMMAGHRPDLVMWLDQRNLQWTTSRYYNPVPTWISGVNSKLKSLKNASYDWKRVGRKIAFTERTAFASPYGIEATTDLALEALENEKLGRGKDQTDFLLISYSSHDYAGHLYGPNSLEMEDMTLHEDQQLSRLLNAIDRQVGLKQTLVMLTADHGIPTASTYLQTHKIKANTLDYLSLFKKTNAHLDAKFGAPKSGPWIEAFKYFNFYINPKVLGEKKLDSAVVSQEIKKVFQSIDGIAAVYTRDDLARGIVAPGYWKDALNNQFSMSNNGDVIFMPEPFFYEKSDDLVTHMTGYNYDTRVPLIFVGSSFRPGVYSQQARVIDLASTLSFVLNVVPPPKARGRVLSEALK